MAGRLSTLAPASTLVIMAAKTAREAVAEVKTTVGRDVAEVVLARDPKPLLPNLLEQLAEVVSTPSVLGPSVLGAVNTFLMREQSLFCSSVCVCV